MPNIRGPELLILVLVIVLLFGAKRLPDAARSVGRSLRIFKAETKGLVDGDEESSAHAPSGQAPSAQAPSARAPPAGPAPAPLPPAAPAPAVEPPPAPSSGADSALAPQADQPPSALQHQPPTQA